jgi:hypothetical protein
MDSVSSLAWLSGSWSSRGPSPVPADDGPHFNPLRYETRARGVVSLNVRSRLESVPAGVTGPVGRAKAQHGSRKPVHLKTPIHLDGGVKNLMYHAPQYPSMHQDRQFRAFAALTSGVKRGHASHTASTGRPRTGGTGRRARTPIYFPTGRSVEWSNLCTSRASPSAATRRLAALSGGQVFSPSSWPRSR